MYCKETEPCSEETKCNSWSCRAVKFFWTKQQSFISQKVSHQEWCPFFDLFVLVDAILQKAVYFKNKPGTGLFFGFMQVSYGNNW